MTGVEEVQSAEPTGTVYDLSGRQMPQRPTKCGLYIRGGKQVVVK